MKSNKHESKNTISKSIDMKGLNYMNKLRLNYYYSSYYYGLKDMCFTIPVQSIYEAALIKINLALTDLIKSEIGATPDYSNSFTLEVCLDEENDEWADWIDEDGYDDIDQWLEKNEPEHYAHIKEQIEYYRNFDNEE